VERPEIELSVGDTLQIGDCVVTVVDIDGDEVSFRVDQAESENLVGGGEQRSALPRK